MPDPTTLVAFAEKRRDDLATRLATTRQEAAEKQTILLGTADKSADLDTKEQQLLEKRAALAALPANATAEVRNELTAAITQLENDIKALKTSIGLAKVVDHCITQLAALDARIAKTRKEIAQVPTGADADRLADTLTWLSIEQARASATLLNAETEVNAARAAFELAQRHAERDSAALTNAKSLVADESQRKLRFDSMVGSLGQEPLSLLVSRAAALVRVINGEMINAGEDEFLVRASQAAQQAKARIENDMPADLRNGLITRVNAAFNALDAARTAVEQAEQVLADHRAQTQGAAAAVARRQMEFERAETALTTHVRQSQNALDISVGLLSAINGSLPLTSAQRAAFHDASLPAVERKAAVRHHIWLNLIHFLQAKQMLARLAQDPNVLVQAYQTAETRLVTELLSETAAATTLDERLDDAWQKRQAATFSESVSQRRILEAVRSET